MEVFQEIARRDRDAYEGVQQQRRMLLAQEEARRAAEQAARAERDPVMETFGHVLEFVAQHPGRRKEESLRLLAVYRSHTPMRVPAEGGTVLLYGYQVKVVRTEDEYERRADGGTNVRTTVVVEPVEEKDRQTG